MRPALLRGSFLAGSTGELQVLFSKDVGSNPADLPPSSGGTSSSSRTSLLNGGGANASTGGPDPMANVQGGAIPGHAQFSNHDQLQGLQQYSQHQQHQHQHQHQPQNHHSPVQPQQPLHPVSVRKGSSPRNRQLSDVVSPSVNSFSPALASMSSLAAYNPLAPWSTGPGVFLSMFSALLYGTVGLTMGFLNKAVLQMWPFSNSLLMFQMAASVAIICFGSLLNLVETRPLTLRTAVSLWGVVFFYNANVAFALAAVQALSIPVYHVLKRLTPVMILICKMIMGEPPPPLQVTLSVCTVVAGCFLSGIGDLSFDLRGYMFAIVSCALQSAYLIFVEQSGSDKGFSSSELMVYNAVLSLPVLVLLTVTTGEATRSIPALLDLFMDPYSSSFAWIFIFSLIAGVLLNYSLFLCTLNNTALTTTIVGALRSVIGTILGFFLLGGVKATPHLIAGCGINTMGGIWYTVAKMRHKMLGYIGSAKPSTPQAQEQVKGQGEEGIPLKSSVGP